MKSGNISCLLKPSSIKTFSYKFFIVHFRNIEGRVVEIAKLQEVFSEKVLEQVC